nr:cobalamin B12-binding domain-containing protein [Sedimentibacter sp.]
MRKKIVLGASIGNCVHVAGIIHFLQIAEKEGYETIFLGPAVPIKEIFSKIKGIEPDLVALSYRLTANNFENLIRDIIDMAKTADCKNIKWCFGGTSPVSQVAMKYDFFDYISDGFDDVDDSIAFLKNIDRTQNDKIYGQTITDRIKEKYPYPVLRHHFGLPSYKETLDGIKTISKSKVLDVISIGPDQNTQQFFFKQEKMDKNLDGAGGVPLRTREEFAALKEAAQFGNKPLLRCYSGTDDVKKFAELLDETISNAWCAVPLCWYNEIDKRGTRTIEVSIKEAFELIKYHGDRNIPVEINEPHHWALRDAHDVISVVMAYLSSYNAKKYGAKDYIAQYMFNTPNTLSFSMDLARVLAMIELCETMQDDKFRIYRQVRAGLNFLSSDLNVAKGQLAATTFLASSVKPHIIHVVGFNEAEHAATPENIIESCKIVRGVIKNLVGDCIDITENQTIQKRKSDLIKEAKYLLNFICDYYEEYEDPLGNSYVIADCVKRGILDAPHILKNEKFKGILDTRVIDGKCVAYSKEHSREISEFERMEILKRAGNI